jgi:hypothetical protein
MILEKPVVEYFSEEDFIFVKESLKATLDSMNYVVGEVVKFSNLHNCLDLLIDATDLESIPSNKVLYFFASELSRREETRNMKIYFAASNWLFAKIHFIEILAQKRGLDFRLFKNVEEAKESLLST